MSNLDVKIKILKEEIAETNNLTAADAVKILELMMELNEEVEAVKEDVKYINDDISELQQETFDEYGEFEEVSLEELEEIENEYTEVPCNSCGKPIFVEKSAIENNNIPCPYCGEIIK